MALQLVAVGNTVGDGLGDSARSAFTKLNAALTEIYRAVGDGSTIYPVGTSGSTIPLTDTSNYWSATQFIRPTGNDGLVVQRTATSELGLQGGRLISKAYTSNFASGRGAAYFYLSIENSSSAPRSAVISVDSDEANSKSWSFSQSTGSAYAAAGSWVNSSDMRLKTNIQEVGKDGNIFAIAKSFKGYSWDRLDSEEGKGAGFIAQDIQKVLPNAVNTLGTSTKLMDGTEVENPLSLDTSAVNAITHNALLALITRVEQLERTVEVLSHG